MNEKKNTIEKLFWRLSFIATSLFKKNLDTILCSLKPAKTRGFGNLSKLLATRGVIKYEEKNKKITYKNIEIFYSDVPPIIDLINIFLLPENNYVKKNFSDNKAFFIEGPYEKDKVILKKNDVVFDVGANFGLFSMLAANKFPNLKIFAFEPIKQTQETFLKNIAVNDFKNIILVPLALGDFVGENKFFVSENLSGMSGVIQESPETITINQTTLDQFIIDNNIDKLDFIKVDIEGMERDFLKGGEKTIKRFKPKIAICVYHLPDDPEVIERLLLEFVPNYKIIKTPTKFYAYID